MAAFAPNMALYGMPVNMDPHGKALNQMNGYGITTPHDMKPPLGHGLTARRYINWFGMFTALVVPVGLFVLTFWVMSFHVYYHHPGMALTIVAAAIFSMIALGALALQMQRAHERAGRRTWHFFVVVTGVFACLLGSLMGALNMAVNAQTYYDYISLRKAIDVDPSQSGQLLLDAGEVDFKNATTVDRSLHSSWHKSQTFCVAPVVNKGGAKLASYDYWAVGMNCCSSKKKDFSCGWTHSHQSPKGLRVLDTDEIQGYKLAVEQAAAAHHITVKKPIFLYMEKLPYLKIKQHWHDATYCAAVACSFYAVIQAIIVMFFSYRYGKGVPSGFMDIDKTYNQLYHHRWHGPSMFI